MGVINLSYKTECEVVGQTNVKGNRYIPLKEKQSDLGTTAPPRSCLLVISEGLSLILVTAWH